MHRGDVPIGTLRYPQAGGTVRDRISGASLLLTYTIVLTEEPDGSAVNVSVPALPGVLTWGATHEEAMASAREAIELHLEGYIERGRPFPLDRRPQGKHVFTVEVKPPVGASRHTA